MKRFRSQLILACGLVLVLGAANVASGVLSNDECHRAMQIAEVTDLPFDTTNATQDGPHHCMYSPNRWYCYTASCTGEVVVSLAGSSFDTMLAVYEGCDCESAWDNMIECNDDTADSRQSPQRNPEFSSTGSTSFQRETERNVRLLPKSMKSVLPIASSR